MNDVRSIDRTSPVPMYHQISSHIIERINQQEWKIGDKLPTEDQFSHYYGVSRLTVRQSLDTLESRGLIRRQRGKGAFLTSLPHPFIESLNLPGFNDTQHFSYDRNMLELSYVQTIDASIKRLFPNTNDADYVFLSRVFQKDQQGIGLNHVWMPSKLVPGVVEHGLEGGSISQTLSKRYNLKVVHVEDYIESCKLNAKEAALLGCDYDAPALRIYSTHYLENDVPIQHSITTWLGNLIRFHFETHL